MNSFGWSKSWSSTISSSSLPGDGTLGEKEGRLFHNMLDYGRVIAANQCSPELKDNHEGEIQKHTIDSWRSAAGWSKLLGVSANMYTYWETPYVRGLASTSVSSLLLQFCKEQALEHSEWEACEKAVKSSGGCKRWTERMTGDFVVYSNTPDGSILSPYDDGSGLPAPFGDGTSPAVLLKVLGIADSIADLVKRQSGQLPAVLNLTILPWKGRLVYDGLVLSDPESMAKMSSPLFGLKVAAIRRALSEGSPVVSGLPSLPSSGDACKECGLKESRTEGDGGCAKLVVCGGCKLARYCGKDCQKANWKAHKEACLEASGKKREGREVKKREAAREAARVAPTEAGRAIVAKLVEKKWAQKANKTTEEFGDLGSSWVFRRCGYTAAENPMNGLCIMAGTEAIFRGGKQGNWYTCAELGPTVDEYVYILADGARQRRALPDIAMVDYLPAVEGLEEVLKGTGVKVHYYPPPSDEEQRYHKVFSGPKS